MSTFDIKLAPKANTEKDYINFYMWSTSPPLSIYNNKILFMNFLNPGKHIYYPYYVVNGTAHALYIKSDINYVTDNLQCTLQDLRIDDIIFHWTKEDVDRHIESTKILREKKNGKP